MAQFIEVTQLNSSNSILINVNIIEKVSVANEASEIHFTNGTNSNSKSMLVSNSYEEIKSGLLK